MRLPRIIPCMLLLELIAQIAGEAFMPLGYAGSQSTVVSMDVKKNLFGGYEVRTQRGKKRTGLDPVTFAKTIKSEGAGEILLCSIDRDGTMKGYDLDLIKRVADAVNIPVGANAGSGAGAASLFVYQSPHCAVLISYLAYSKIRNIVRKNE